MERDKLIVGNNLITRRYLGSKLLWSDEKILKILTDCYLELTKPYIVVRAKDTSFYNVSLIKKVIVNDKELQGLSNVILAGNTYQINFQSTTFKDSFLESFGW